MQAAKKLRNSCLLCISVIVSPGKCGLCWLGVRGLLDVRYVGDSEPFRDSDEPCVQSGGPRHAVLAIWLGRGLRPWRRRHTAHREASVTLDDDTCGRGSVRARGKLDVVAGVVGRVGQEP